MTIVTIVEFAAVQGGSILGILALVWFVHRRLSRNPNDPSHLPSYLLLSLGFGFLLGFGVLIGTGFVPGAIRFFSLTLPFLLATLLLGIGLTGAGPAVLRRRVAQEGGSA